VDAHIGNYVIKRPDFLAYVDVHPLFGLPNGENAVNEFAVYFKVLLDNS